MLAKAKLVCRALFVLSAAVVSSCVPHDHSEQSAIVGWTCVPSYGGCDESGLNRNLAHATVGLPFEWRLVGRCSTGDWNLERSELATGRLPPGLEFKNSYGDAILGVPTRAGSFSFSVTHYGMSCPGSNFMPYGDHTWAYTIEVRGN